MNYLHIVDLDGALQGEAVNVELIHEIKKASHMRIEVGGGIRHLSQIKTYLMHGVDRVIIGSMAVKHPEFVKEAIELFGSEKIVIGIDATDGWLEQSQMSYLDLAKQMASYGATIFIYTDIDKDGTLSGPRFSHYEALVDLLPDSDIIASGGVHSVADLKKLEKIGVSGTIVGKAYYSGNISLEEMAEIEKRQR